MGRKFRLSAHRKNEERKRSFVVSVQRDAVSVMAVSFPAEKIQTRDFLKNTQALRVVNGVCRNIKGNCRGSEENCPDYATPLPKHSRKHV